MGQRAAVIASCRHFADDAGLLTCLPSRGIHERTADRPQRDQWRPFPSERSSPQRTALPMGVVAVSGDASNSDFLATTRSLGWSRAVLASTGSALFPRGSGELMQARRYRSPEIVFHVSTS